MKRRDFFRTAMWGGALMIFGKGGALAKEYYPVQVDETLWQGINRVKNPAEESELEKLHSPVMKVPAEGIFILDQSRAGLEKAPGFDKADWPDIGDRGWRSGINAFYLQHVPCNQASAAPLAPGLRGKPNGAAIEKT